MTATLFTIGFILVLSDGIYFPYLNIWGLILMLLAATIETRKENNAKIRKRGIKTI